MADGGCRHQPDDGWGRDDRPVINVTWSDAQAYVSWLSRKTGQLWRLPSEAEWEYAARAGTTTRFSTGRCINTSQANYDDRVRFTDFDCDAKTGGYLEKIKPIGRWWPLTTAVTFLLDGMHLDWPPTVGRYPVNSWRVLDLLQAVGWRWPLTAALTWNGGRVHLDQTQPVGSYPANPWGFVDLHGNVAEWTDDCWNNSYLDAPITGRAWTIGDCTVRVVRGGSWGDDLSSLSSASRDRLNIDDWNNHLGFRVARTINP